VVAAPDFGLCMMCAQQGDILYLSTGQAVGVGKERGVSSDWPPLFLLSMYYMDFISIEYDVSCSSIGKPNLVRHIGFGIHLTNNFSRFTLL